MSRKIIAKFSPFVIPIACAAVFFCSCTGHTPKVTERTDETHYLPPKVVGTIKSKDINESSGVAASRCQANVLWTHNDSGDDAYIYAINTAGESLGTWRVPNGENNDWEDIAAFKDSSGKCFIYIGDTGDNKGKRPEHAVYRVREPVIAPEDANSSRKQPLTTESAEIVRFKYPDYSQDAETLMVHPGTGDIYVVTKRVTGPAGIYCLRHPQLDGSLAQLEKVTDISVPAIPNGFVTGGDISPDGRRAVICDYTQAYEWILPDGDANFDDIWRQVPEPIDLGKREHGEAISYSIDGTSLFATSEHRGSPVIEIKQK